MAQPCMATNKPHPFILKSWLEQRCWLAAMQNCSRPSPPRFCQIPLQASAFIHSNYACFIKHPTQCILKVFFNTSVKVEMSFMQSVSSTIYQLWILHIKHHCKGQLLCWSTKCGTLWTTKQEHCKFYSVYYHHHHIISFTLPLSLTLPTAEVESLSDAFSG